MCICERMSLIKVTLVQMRCVLSTGNVLIRFQVSLSTLMVESMEAVSMVEIESSLKLKLMTGQLLCPQLALLCPTLLLCCCSNIFIRSLSLVGFPGKSITMLLLDRRIRPSAFCCASQPDNNARSFPTTCPLLLLQRLFFSLSSSSKTTASCLLVKER